MEHGRCLSDFLEDKAEFIFRGRMTREVHYNGTGSSRFVILPALSSASLPIRVLAL